MENRDFFIAQTLVNAAQRISLIAHQNPDGDAIGSTLGLAQYLREKNKAVTVIVPDPAPLFLNYLPGYNEILDFSQHPQETQKTLEESQLIFCLDFGQLHRCGEVANLLKNLKTPLINIDHHPEPDNIYAFSMHEIAASSTCELTYFFLKGLDPEFIPSYPLSECLYTGLITDTGCFKYAVRPKTMHVASRLLRSGITPEDITARIFDVNTEERLKMVGFALAEKLVILPAYRTAYISLTQDEMNRFHSQKGDTEGLVNYALSVKGMVMAAFFSEREAGITRISLRSKGNFAVNELSKAHFGGGGHLHAAGGKFEGTPEEAVQYFLNILPDYQQKLLENVKNV